MSGIDPKEASARRAAVAKRMSNAVVPPSRFRGLGNWLTKRGGLRAIAISAGLAAVTEVVASFFRHDDPGAWILDHPARFVIFFLVLTAIYAVGHIPWLLASEPWQDENAIGLAEGPPFDPAKLFPKKGPGRGAWRKLREPMRRPEKRG